MLRGSSRQGGFTIIELAIVMALVAILLRLAVPMIGKTVKNVQVRTTAEALQNGIRQAQSESVAESRQTVVALTNATPAINAAAAGTGKTWYVQSLALLTNELVPKIVVTGSTTSLTSGTTITGPPTICFNSLGRQTVNATPGPVGGGCTATAATYDITNSQADRPLRVTVSTAGQVRMCDPAKTLSTTNPDGC